MPAPAPDALASSVFGVAEVVIDGLPLAEAKPYHYAVPEGLWPRLRPGSLVTVPFGSRSGVGAVVTRLAPAAEAGGRALKPVEEVVDGLALPEPLFELLRWVGETTLTPLAAVLQTATPKGALARVERRLVLAVPPEGFVEAARARPAWAELAAALVEAGEEGLKQGALSRHGARSRAAVSAWRAAGLVAWRTRFEAPAKVGRAQTRIEPGPLWSAWPETLTKRQRSVAEALRPALDGPDGGAWLAPALDALRTTRPTVAALAAAGLLSLAERPVDPRGAQRFSHAKPLALTPTQAAAIEAIRGAGDRPVLLEGVTGSGKTEVYLQVIEAMLAAGRGVIALVPEIALTPQTVARFAGRFGPLVAVLHSGLSAAERLSAWKRVQDGEARVVVGARSAIFAPVADLGLIVIDEEHDGAYKQDSAPRYHARTVAAERARREGATLVLGSATPCVESRHMAEVGAYVHVRMPERVNGRPLPPLAIVDMRKELEEGNRSMFSRPLDGALEAAIANGEQAILLLNRRGYASCVFCRDCGQAVKCERCAVSMTHHARPVGLRCHYCDAWAPVPEACPGCGSHRVKPLGAGTQQLEEAVLSRFPGVRTLRVDRDTTRGKDGHEKLLSAFGRGEAEVLIGTQMVAKGLDFPRVTVVGVMVLDGALNLPDFRASEHAYHLLTQVAGRAGRHELAGRVVIQTYMPEHPAVVAAGTGDQEGFYRAELEARRELGYPPFMQLANVVFSAEAAQSAVGLAERFVERIDGPVVALGPTTAPLARLRGLTRYQVLLKAPDAESLRAAIRAAGRGLRAPGVRVSVDIDPGSLL